MDTNSDEKKPKRPRISQMPASSGDNQDFKRYEKVNYGNRPSADESENQTADDQSLRHSYRPYNRQGGYQQRQGGYNNRQGGFNNRQGGYNNYNNHYNNGGYNRQGGYQQRPRPDYNAGAQTEQNGEAAATDSAAEQQPQTTYQPRQQGGYNKRPAYNQGGNRQGGYQQRQGGYNNRQEGGFNNRQGGYNNQGGNRQGGYQQRQGGYNNNRQGGYNNQGGNRQGGFNNRQGGYQQRQGGYNNNRQGGYNRQQSDNFPGRGKSFTPRPKRIEYEVTVPDPDEQIRLNKYMSNAGLCSRREADEFIQQGLVKVNGVTVTELGTKITHSDVVEYNDKVVTLESKCYILLNKPKDCVTTSDDPNGRLTVMDLVKGACPERIYPVGRLDRNTTGVLLLTNDGDLASKLTHPKYVKKKIYHVWCDRDIAEEDMQRIADGIELEDGPIHADAISYATETDRNQAGIEIHSGRNRIVRRIFESLGYHVTKLDRVYFAGLTKKNLPRGRWRYLTQEEVNFLKMGSFE